MAKKDFASKIAQGAEAFMTQPHQAQNTADAQQAQESADMYEARKTQGVKGARMPRVNVSLTPSTMEYLRTMAAIRGKTYCQYLQEVLEKDMKANSEIYEQARELVKNAR